MCVQRLLWGVATWKRKRKRREHFVQRLRQEEKDGELRQGGHGSGSGRGGAEALCAADAAKRTWKRKGAEAGRGHFVQRRRRREVRTGGAGGVTLCSGCGTPK